MQPARNARGRATARRIEATAVRLAGERGLDGLTVDAICAEAGVGQRTFFHHFPTKEDALLGLDLPVLDEERVRAYLSDPQVGVLSGTIGLVRLPPPDDPALMLARLHLISTSPALFRRQGERLMPLLHEVRGLVLIRLRVAASAGSADAPAGPDDRTLQLQADLVTAIGAALMQAVGVRAVQTGVVPAPGAPQQLLEALRPVWDTLL